MPTNLAMSLISPTVCHSLYSSLGGSLNFVHDSILFCDYCVTCTNGIVILLRLTDFELEGHNKEPACKIR